MIKLNEESAAVKSKMAGLSVIEMAGVTTTLEFLSTLTDILHDESITKEEKNKKAAELVTAEGIVDWFRNSPGNHLRLAARLFEK